MGIGDFLNNVKKNFTDPLKDWYNKLNPSGVSSSSGSSTDKKINIENKPEILAGNNIFFESKNPTGVNGVSNAEGYNLKEKHSKFNRYGYIDPYHHEQVLREYLFFTKPDLRIFEGQDMLNEDLKDVPIFIEALRRNKASLYSLTKITTDGNKTPFMNLLTNGVTSKLDLPDISAASQTTTTNLMGINVSIRGHSWASDNGFDFNLNFYDNSSLDIYMMVKIYDEYIRRSKIGQITYEHVNRNYIMNNIDPTQFSIYKFLVGQDAETILYYAKVTGVYFTGVPRGEFGDPSDFGRFSLGFHGQFVEDNNPIIIKEFNNIVKSVYPAAGSALSGYAKVYDDKLNCINNKWVTCPYIDRTDRIVNAITGTDKRAKRRAPGGSENSYFSYRLKWIE